MDVQPDNFLMGLGKRANQVRAGWVVGGGKGRSSSFRKGRHQSVRRRRVVARCHSTQVVTRTKMLN